MLEKLKNLTVISLRKRNIDAVFIKRQNQIRPVFAKYCFSCYFNIRCYFVVIGTLLVFNEGGRIYLVELNVIGFETYLIDMLVMFFLINFPRLWYQ